MATAAKWTLQFRRLTKPSTGIRSRFMRQLYCTVAIPKFTYAADVWYTPVMRGPQQAKATGSVGATKRLASIQRIAITTISGMLCTTATCQDEPMLHTFQFPHPLHISIVCDSLMIHTDYFYECKVPHTRSHFHTQPKSEECGMCHCDGIISFVHP